VSWYLETWRTPQWRRVLKHALAGLGLGAWYMALDVARDRARAAGPWPDVLGAAVPFAVAWLLLCAAAAGWAIRCARVEGRTVAALATTPLAWTPFLALFASGRVVAVRDPRAGDWILAAAFVALGLVAVTRPRRWFSWTSAAVAIGVGVWLALRP
jgi:hypothetical protein